MDYNTIKKNYTRGLWSIQQVAKAVEKNIITEEEFVSITNVSSYEALDLEAARAMKLNEVSIACQTIIYEGSDVTLTDGTVGHFSFDDQDQINIKQAYDECKNNNLEIFPYHQDGHLCKYYISSDIIKIAETLMALKLYHTTYCNALNIWIKSCSTKDEIMGIYYGVKIPEEYTSEVLKALLANK